MSRTGRTVIGVAVIVGTLGYLVEAGIGANLVYFVTPTELFARQDPATGQPLRLSGTVEPGSVDWDADDLRLTFRLSDDAHAIPVESTGAPPHMFQDGIQVIVEGHLDAKGVFQANNLMVKHSNEYGPEPESGAGPQLPIGPEQP